MDVTRRCDYACRILRAAYKSGDSYVSVSDIAEQEDIPYAFARSIQHDLVKGGLIKTVRGARGGLALNCDPAAVTLLEADGLPLPEKRQVVSSRKKFRFKELTGPEKAALIAEQPAYGRVICRCETVTEGEITAACRTPIPPRSIGAVKRRTNAGMGRCQGGFCGPRVMEILCRELGYDPLQVPQDQAGAAVLVGRTKQGGREA